MVLDRPTYFHTQGITRQIDGRELHHVVGWPKTWPYFSRTQTFRIRKCVSSHIWSMLLTVVLQLYPQALDDQTGQSSHDIGRTNQKLPPPNTAEKGWHYVPPPTKRESHWYKQRVQTLKQVLKQNYITTKHCMQKLLKP